FALRALACELAGAADGFRLLTGPAFRRLFVMAAKLHLAEDALALHLLLQRLEGLVDIVVANENLHASCFLLNPVGCAEGQGGLPSRAPIVEREPKVYQGCGFLAVSAGVPTPAAPQGRGGSSDDVRRELVFDLNDKVAQLQLALLQTLDLEEIGARGVVEGLDRSIQIAVLLSQPHQLRLELGLLVVRQRHRFIAPCGTASAVVPPAPTVRARGKLLKLNDFPFGPWRNLRSSQPRSAPVEWTSRQLSSHPQASNRQAGHRVYHVGGDCRIAPIDLPPIAWQHRPVRGVSLIRWRHHI